MWLLLVRDTLISVSQQSCIYHLHFPPSPYSMNAVNAAKHCWCVTNRSNLPTETAAPDRTTINSLWITLRWIRLLKYLIVMHQLGCFLTKLRPYKIMSNTCTEQGTSILKKTISISPCSFPPLANTGATVFRMLTKIFWLDEIVSLNRGEEGSL